MSEPQGAVTKLERQETSSSALHLFRWLTVVPHRPNCKAQTKKKLLFHHENNTASRSGSLQICQRLARAFERKAPQLGTDAVSGRKIQDCPQFLPRSSRRSHDPLPSHNQRHGVRANRNRCQQNKRAVRCETPQCRGCGFESVVPAISARAHISKVSQRR
jgi:hypothetical protein